MASGEPRSRLRPAKGDRGPRHRVTPGTRGPGLEWREKLDQITIESAAYADAGGWASEEDRAALAAQPLAWAAALRRLIHETDDSLRAAASEPETELRGLILADLTAERERLAAALLRVTGDSIDAPVLRLDHASHNGKAAPDGEAVRRDGGRDGAREPAGRPGPAAEDSGPPGPPCLHASWGEGRIVIWAGGPGVEAGPDDLDGLLERLEASSIGWERHAPVTLPSGGTADARSAPLSQTLGWLVGIGAGQAGEEAGSSLRWLGEVALWGTELVALGHMVPVLRSATGGSSGTKGGSARHRVRWVPALVGRERLHDLVVRMPGAVAALQTGAPADAVARSILAAVVDAVSRAGAGRLVAPAAPPHAANRSEIAEALLSGLDGRPFQAEAEPAGRVAEDLKRWASPVTSNHRVGLIVRLDPPQSDGGWLLTVEATGVDKHPMPVEHALVVSSGTKSQQVEAQLKRLEKLVPALRRPTTRRGQVVLDGDEAVELMFTTGPSLSAAGFEVMLPKVSRRKPSPQLRLFAEALGGESQVGVRQLSNVRWTVLFDDLELDAADISRLAQEASPLVRVRGRWVHLDRADLHAAAAALAERAAITQMSGAEMIRHAVGLEGSALGGPVRVDGTGWAAELLKGATSHPPAPIDTPDGFAGQLRSYQAEAAGWLGFLDRAGLGGCLAMDMGLGKTPTLLAHLLVDKGHGPNLVICPPAVLGNWSAEATRFTRGLKVSMHHGPRRAEGESIAKMAAVSDVVLTTYATAVRDIDALSAIEWRRVVVDEAQVIKNHTSDTARELRRLSAHSRLALTGTPVENGLGDLWAILDWTNPGLVGGRTAFIENLSRNTAARQDADTDGPTAPVGRRSSEESALRALNGLLIFRRTKNEPEIAAELPDKVDRLDHCSMTPEQIGLYQAVVNRLLDQGLEPDANQRKGQVLAAITALKQICDHPAAFLGEDDDQDTLHGRSGKLARLEEIVGEVFAAGEKILVFTHFARWGEKLATHLSERTGVKVGCYHGGLSRTVRDEMVAEFQASEGPGALVLSIKAGGSGLNLTAASHVVLYDRWWNPAVEDQARDRAWRIGQQNTVMCHRLVCPGTVDERVEEIVAGKRRIAGMVLPARSTLGDLDAEQLRVALGLRDDELVEDEPTGDEPGEEEAA
ncbi:MAG TPA: SNF2-related protein [Acidimicrobiales bacterium]|nr:SNF2-related protein [Acidimicrobiales bacterium]